MLLSSSPPLNNFWSEAVFCKFEQYMNPSKGRNLLRPVNIDRIVKFLCYIIM